MFSAILISFSAQSQDNEQTVKRGQFSISTGYAFPSALRIYLKVKPPTNEIKVNGYGPFMLKADFCPINNFTIGLSAAYNFSDIYWFQNAHNALGVSESFQYGVEVNEFALGLRLNYHFYNKKNWDCYGGAGFGYGILNVETYTYAPKSTWHIQHTFTTPRHYEATVGSRYFLDDHLGLFAELGIGQSWYLYRHYFFPAAFIQGGISIKF